MTTQTAVVATITGQSLTAKHFTVAAPDTEVTGNTTIVTERTNAKGEYVVSTDRVAVLSGDHTIILFNGSVPVAIAKRTYAGTNLEVATVTGIAAVLDSAAQAQIDKIEAAVAGTVTGAGTSTEVFVGPSATLTITVDASGNRSSVVVT